MFFNELKLKFRSFLKDKFYTLLNITGLSIGISVSIIILLYLQNDLTYDQYNKKHDRIFRLVTNVKGPGVEFHSPAAARELGPMLKDNFPEIELYARFLMDDEVLVSLPGDKSSPAFREKSFCWTDSTVFDIFTFPFIAGNPKTALTQPHSIVLTKKLADKYFKTPQDALGKSLLLFDDKQNFVVTGVMKDLPDNTHMKFNALLSVVESRTWATKNGQFNSEAIWNPDAYTYLLFQKGYHAQELFRKLQPFYNKYIKPFGDIVSSKLWFYLEPLASVHFHSKQEEDFPQGNVAYIYAFGAIGIFILLLACINYINMATARSGKRMKEIGLRKIFGSGRKQLTLSVLLESLVLSFVALLLSWLLVFIILYATPFNELIQKNLTLNIQDNPLLLFGSIGIALLIGLLSGLYPAIYLPSLNVIKSMRGSFHSTSTGINLRRLLVIVQFTISIGVIICTLIMKDQIRFVRNKDLGFNKDHLLIVPVEDSIVEHNIPVIRNELNAYSGIKSVALAYNVPGGRPGAAVYKVETDSIMANQAFNGLWVGGNFIKTMGFKILAGRDFHENNEGDKDSRSFIINETAARRLGWYDPNKKGSSLNDALGKEIMQFHGKEPGHVIGVVKDFNITSLHNPIEPELIVPTDDGGNFYIRLSGANLVNTMDFLKKKWATLDPSHPFDYYFLDDHFNESYNADERQSNLISILSGICMAVSLLGIFGLSAFNAEQRTKEIGVRKVLGASGPQLIFLLFRDILILIMVAAVLASPLAWYVANLWLRNFAFKTNIDILLFVLTGASALLIAFITTSFHSVRTSSLNPVDTLRYE